MIAKPTSLMEVGFFKTKEGGRMKQQITIIDYAFHGPITCFIHVQGYDETKEQKFSGMIRMVDGTPYGDIISKNKSPLSAECIQSIKDYVIQKYKNGYFI